MRAVLGALNPTGDDPMWPTRSTEFAGYLVELVEEAFVANGWRPPLPEQPGPSPWDAYVAAYREFQEADPHGATAHPTAHHMHALEAALRAYNPPPASSWWEAAKKLRRCLNVANEQLDAQMVVNIETTRALAATMAERTAAEADVENLTAVRDELAHQRDDHRARADAAEAKLAALLPSGPFCPNTMERANECQCIECSPSSPLSDSTGARTEREEKSHG